MATKKDARIQVDLGVKGKHRWPCHMLKGGLAVVRPEGMKNWASVTHVATGYSIVSTRLLSTAKKALEELLDLPVDWAGDGKSIEAMAPEVQEELRNIVKRNWAQ